MLPSGHCFFSVLARYHPVVLVCWNPDIDIYLLELLQFPKIRTQSKWSVPSERLTLRSNLLSTSPFSRGHLPFSIGIAAFPVSSHFPPQPKVGVILRPPSLQKKHSYLSAHVTQPSEFLSWFLSNYSIKFKFLPVL